MLLSLRKVINQLFCCFFFKKKLNETNFKVGLRLLITFVVTNGEKQTWLVLTMHCESLKKRGEKWEIAVSNIENKLNPKSIGITLKKITFSIQNESISLEITIFDWNSIIIDEITFWSRKQWKFPLFWFNVWQ